VSRKRSCRIVSVIGVSTMPKLIALTRMPKRAHSRAALIVRPMVPALAAP